jgi:hypothetical protein
MPRTWITFVLAVLLVQTTFAQGKNNSLEGIPWNERIVTGGGVGLSFGSTADYVTIQPLIGYALTRKLVAGTGLTYRYTKYKTVTPAVTFNDFGINPFIRFTVYNGIFLQTEYEYLSYEYYVTADQKDRNGFSSFLAGGGFMQPIGDKAAFFVVALYNFSYTASTSLYTPYYSPWVIRAGISIGGVSF